MALEFNNANSRHVSIADNPSLRPSSIAVSAWLKTSDTGAYRGIVDKIASSVGYLIDVNSNNVRFTVQNISASGGTVADGSWHFIVGTFNSGTGESKIYVDGVWKETANASLSHNTSSLEIGGDGASTYYFTGEITDVRVYNRVLSLEEIQVIYRLRGSDNIVHGLLGRWLLNEKHDGATATVASSVIDISGQGNHGTPYNSPVYRESILRKRGGMSI